jgi:hypothetical protein
MDNRKITELLSGWSRKLTESVRPGLAQEIKQRIPDRLAPHGIGTINIVIDLRASRIAVAAAILIGLAVLAGVVGSRGGIFQAYRDSKLFVKYALVGEDAYRGESLGDLMNLRDNLMSQGREVTYYGDRGGPKDGMTILMQWKIADANDPNGTAGTKYGIVMGDFSAQTVTPATLIRLQSRMLQRSR